jgi:hypothetical protein
LWRRRGLRGLASVGARRPQAIRASATFRYRCCFATASNLGFRHGPHRSPKGALTCGGETNVNPEPRVNCPRVFRHDRSPGLRPAPWPEPPSIRVAPGATPLSAAPARHPAGPSLLPRRPAQPIEKARRARVCLALLIDGATLSVCCVEYDIEREIEALGQSGLLAPIWIAKTLLAAASQMP